MPRFAVHWRSGKWSGGVLSVTANDADGALEAARGLAPGADVVTLREMPRRQRPSAQLRLVPAGAH
jgi:hypothetical protein